MSDTPTLTSANRKKPMALRFESPMSAAQLRWLTTGPAIVRSLCFAAEEQRAFMVGALSATACSHFMTGPCDIMVIIHGDHSMRPASPARRCAWACL